jgi:hypothetical protein
LLIRWLGLALVCASKTGRSIQTITNPALYLPIMIFPLERQKYIKTGD